MYRAIGDYALIGDSHTAALISSAGSIDWACFPDFNSPAVFLRLLDDAQGGYCSIEPAKLLRSQRRYLEATNILETIFETETGSLTVLDFMPVRQADAEREHGQDLLSDHRIIRLLRCTEGAVECRVELKPTFDYARARAQVFRRDARVAMFSSGPVALYAQLTDDVEWLDDAVAATVKLEKGACCPIVLTFTPTPDREVEPLSDRDARAALEETRRYWRQWADSCESEGEYREQVLRSALTLKLLTYESSGAIIAAPTTSLPEWIGGSRNWDYRYCWLRDSTFTLIALMNLGYFGEAHDFFKFLHRTLPASAGKYQILYGICSERDAEERELPRLSGYRDSRPVRIGNGAAQQTQLDIFGELVHGVDLYWSDDGFEHHDEDFERDFWPMVESIADYVAHHWADRGSSMWEMRGSPSEFTHEKAMCWLALDRTLSLAKRHHIEAPELATWKRELDLISESLRREGFNRQLGAYVQQYGSDKADASLLRLPLMGVISAQHPRMRGTIALIEKQLLRNGLLYRYPPGEDGIGEHEGAFTACSFWLVENYILQGRLDEAEQMFRHLLSLANDVGLMAEELDPETGEQLGNFPQGFTHIGLINAAVRLSKAKQGDLPARSGVLRPTSSCRTLHQEGEEEKAA